MILSDSSIRDFVERDMIIPFREENLSPASYDITLGDTFLIPEATKAQVFGQDLVCYKRVQAEYIVMEPGDFLLAETVETVTMPDNIAAEVKSRSSTRRFGVSICGDAGYCDPGFSGKITLKIKNDAAYPVVLRAGSRIGQLVFYQVDYRVHRPYSGKYQNQSGVTGAKADPE